MSAALVFNMLWPDPLKFYYQWQHWQGKKIVTAQNLKGITTFFTLELSQ